MDDKEQLNNPSELESSATESKGSRLDAAKAFFRSLNAGTDANESVPGVDPMTAAAALADYKNMENRLTEAEKKAAEADQLYKRMAADFENYRRRIDRERDEFVALGVQKAVEALLPALDDMDRGLGTLSADMEPEKLLESLKLVCNRVTRCLEAVGVKPMNAIGEPFDPRFHEPVQEIETTDFPDGSVMQELRRGYTLNDKVVRPSLVNVASNPVQAGQNQPAQPSFAEPEEIYEEGSGKPVKVYDLSEFDDSDQSDVSG